ncbi:hypothetical protein FVE85_5981 [Porphyridium purpureum]|uniref:Uncharacterized protein n=1 Tax=Porphyridium purpureum TaxID=35688 RepID=A0A5J4Z429_PORPP|nr:hypothetical protein FVE85_5981 [Porphyridium purpureum]|eukprot:POR3475..scf295_1
MEKGKAQAIMIRRNGSCGEILPSRGSASSLASSGASSAAARSQSMQMLDDSEVLQFLARVDLTLREAVDGPPVSLRISADDMQRLDLFYAQAAQDDCHALMEIVEHLQMEYDKHMARLSLAAMAGPSRAPLSSSVA